MRFTPTQLPGVVVVEVEPRADDRGLFARTFCRDEFAAAGLCGDWVQCNVSYNARAGTLRGLHWQAEPHVEVKLVRCTAGAADDVIADLRPGSASCRRWVAVEITAASRRAVYIPVGCAHGFQAFTDGTDLFYQMSAPHVSAAARGAKWDDPSLAIEWPRCASRIIAPRDLAWEILP
ncbi:dtdp-4-dehydrorhamnose -epimerase : dTDP-4-dehydrorhamnose 3,5-epimerase OS=Arthrospira platensis (strain NIES-39 / IAM M-135) GN=rfbC PE=4 SV=1: dTDP_sugar_isom [Gemmataceae bacterium]|nr:dtdp-4-dehydrorhamnose -epimerase : dTDP-4-dehydrorhamnose 3,5-epimerase OS=Arthrospira platensis (strain NIES-39 / IAM M-135) GN=rfbC PE=4 SV=1: dTDP_sugar_isom [Gemmataceae bacterium]VTT96633.1 dtdp-4-dehydrorhamnose -epimerase : dTDP-4-dehydrorhamnose 3,5-epimerase OS=Arthrospira platensis (strain NIES-39 / IAM M-135) GN=rfbC PE=4 SV=1: dTDP_sugar_isom [Gemmataceae bacterium]